jgi:hypothetical protein
MIFGYERQNFSIRGEVLQHDSKYSLCGQNATEFGLVSKTCKAIRILLAEALTQHNNLEIVNTLTKKMRSFLIFDTLNLRGQHNLQTAFTSSEAQQAFKAYLFTPGLTLCDNTIEIQIPRDLLEVQQGYLGMQFHYLFFDFEIQKGHLVSEAWQMKPLANKVSITTPNAQSEGFWISMTAFEFFFNHDGEWMPILAKEKRLVVADF